MTPPKEELKGFQRATPFLNEALWVVKG